MPNNSNNNNNNVHFAVTKQDSTRKKVTCILRKLRAKVFQGPYLICNETNNFKFRVY